MAIVVKPTNRIFKVVLEHEEDKIEFGFKQLSYKTKGDITAQVSTVEKGQFLIDSTLQVFLNIKYALKTISGVQDEDGKPYKLAFEKGPVNQEVLTDECVDELLATVLSDSIQYIARELSGSIIPTEIKHPLTGKPLPGVEVILPKKGDGVQKK